MNKNIQIFLEIIEENSVVLLNDYSHFFNNQNSLHKTTGLSLRNDLRQNSFRSNFEQGYSQKELIGAGRISRIDIMDRLTAQAYYNPQIIGLVNLLLGSETKSLSDDDQVTDLVFRELGIKENMLVHIIIPKKFVHKTYKELFVYLVTEKDMIALGLYRYII
jgi:hypothetical protein